MFYAVYECLSLLLLVTVFVVVVVNEHYTVRERWRAVRIYESLKIHLLL